MTLAGFPVSSCPNVGGEGLQLLILHSLTYKAIGGGWGEGVVRGAAGDRLTTESYFSGTATYLIVRGFLEGLSMPGGGAASWKPLQTVPMASPGRSSPAVHLKMPDTSGCAVISMG